LTFQTCVLTLLLANAGFPQSGNWQDLVARGRALELAGEYAAAAVCYHDAVRIAERFDPKDARRFLAATYLATTYDELGRFPDAEREYRRALHAAERAGGKTSSGYAMVLGNLASLYADLGQTARGEALMRESVAIQGATAMPNDVTLAVARMQLAEILLRPGKFAEAEQLLNDSLEVLHVYPGPSSQTAAVLNDLGIVQQQRGKDVPAEHLFKQSIAMVEGAIGPEHPLLLRPLNNVAVLCDRKGRKDEASSTFLRALAIAEVHLGSGHPFYAILLLNYSVFLRHIGDTKGTKAIEVQSQQLLRNSTRRNGVGKTIDVSEFKRK
jgi:tetratricopeptide (TPR) repeat protein